MPAYEFQNALFPFSADPPHKGHKNVMCNALKFCARLIVLILSNEGKKHTFSIEKREEMVRELVSDLPKEERDRIEIRSSDGLMCYEYLRFGCDALIRGVRDERDQAYEEDYIAKQALLFPWFSGTPVIAITAHGERIKIASTIAEGDKMKYISSTVIKAAVQAHLPVDQFVPVPTQQALEEALNGHYKLGVTGTISTGKTAVTGRLKDLIEARYGIDVHVLGIDGFVREIYADPCVGCDKLRRQLAERFGEAVLTNSGTDVDRVFLKSQLFGTPDADEARRYVENITRPHVQRLYCDKLRAIRREKPRAAPQLILLEWAQPVSAGLSAWSNGNVLLIDAPSAERARAAEQRGISAERLAATLSVQGTTADLAAALEQRGDHVLTFLNRWLSPSADVLCDQVGLTCEILKLFPGLMK